MQRVQSRCRKTESAKSKEQRAKTEIKKWEKPTLEDVSGKIMAQPYIRFT